MFYIANSTRQDFWFHYRLPGDGPKEKWGGPFPLLIPSGQQRSISRDLSPDEKKAIIMQLEKHGAHDAAEAHAKIPGFMGLLYRDEGIISEDEIVLGHEEVKKAVQDRSVKTAVRGALGFDSSARRGAGRKTPPARETQFEIRQDTAPGSRPTGDEVAMDIIVSPDGRTDVSVPV